MDTESTSKKPKAWWVILFDEEKYINKIERTAPSETLEKRTILLHGNKFDERIHVDKFSKLKES